MLAAFPADAKTKSVGDLRLNGRLVFSSLFWRPVSYFGLKLVLRAIRDSDQQLLSERPVKGGLPCRQVCFSLFSVSARATFWMGLFWTFLGAGRVSEVAAWRHSEILAGRPFYMYMHVHDDFPLICVYRCMLKVLRVLNSQIVSIITH